VASSSQLGDIRFNEPVPIKLRKAMVVECFPTVGFVSTIAGAYLVRVLHLSRVGSLSAPWLPAVAVVADGRPLPPIRIYQGPNTCGLDGDCDQIAVVISEFPVPEEAAQPLGEALIEWVASRGGREIVSLEGLPVRAIPAEGTKGGALSITFAHDLPPVQGLPSTPRARAALERMGLRPMEAGLVSGVSGVLMWEAAERQFDALCLLADAFGPFPDARAAAALVRAMDPMLKGIHVDIKPLLEQAASIEDEIKQGIEQIVRVVLPRVQKTSEPSPAMYH
jgi:uncharacterized protein